MDKCNCTPLKKYTFDEIGEFIFESHWRDSKSVGINIHLVKIMMNSFLCEWDSNTDKFKIEIIPKMLSLNFSGNEIRNKYKVTPVF